MASEFIDGTPEPRKLRDRQIDEQDAALRGKAVEMFARLERSLDSIIVNYYVAGHPLTTYFSLDLLMSENFSYGLRREVFEGIIRRHGWYDDARMQHLYKVGRWRNFLAHVGGMETHDYNDDPSNPKIGLRDPKSHKTLTVTEAFERFKPEYEKADDYVTEIASKCFPIGKFGMSGHVVTEPTPPGGFPDPWQSQHFLGEIEHAKDQKK